MLTLATRDSPVHRIDPRVRLAMALGWAGATATVSRGWGLVVAVLFGAVLCLAARVPTRALARRLLSLNLFMLVLVAVLPWSASGSPLFAWGNLAYRADGVARAVEIACRANAVLLVVSALVSTMDPVTLGHVLASWRVPAKLTRLLFFTARYLDLMHAESVRTRRALEARAFEPRAGLRTLRIRAYQAGLLLVRAHDRSEQVLLAMQCRGFTGDFPRFHRFRLTRRDGWFAAAAGLALALTVVGSLA